MRHSIGHLTLGERPLIAAALTDRDVQELDAASAASADIIELRVDLFEGTAPEHVQDIFRHAREKFGKPLIVTVRDTREGGRKEFDDRAGLYRLLVPLSDAADVEINAGEVMAEVRTLCRAHRKPLIGSSHHFNETPDDAVLEEIALRGRRQGADIVKIAAMASGREDMVRLLLFTFRRRDEGMITMSMGAAGLPSRVVGFLFGSLVTYGYVTNPSAPGQLSLAELEDLLRRLGLRP